MTGGLTSALCLAVGLLAAVTSACAQTVHFSLSDVGQDKSITSWGADTAWPSPDNMRQAITHMGADQIDVVRVNFYIDEPLQANGTLGPAARQRLDVQLDLASMPGDKPIAITPNSGDPTDPWYLLNGNEVRTDRWLDVLRATTQYLRDHGKTVVEIEPFNEPDFWDGQGTPQNLAAIAQSLKADRFYAGVDVVGPSTLNSDNFGGWYGAVQGPVDYGATHQLGGSADSYVDFIQQVKAAGDTPYNPEIHSIGEVLYGAEYGLEGGIWWGPALRARGLIVNGVQGSRLGYAENRVAGTAAAVYRAPDGAVHAFAGGFEREYQGTPNQYRLHSTEGEVYYNGVGPIRDYFVYAGQNNEGASVAIQTEAETDVHLDGSRWRLVNRLTGETLQVPSAGLGDGADIRVAADAGLDHQRWDLVRSIDGYYTLSAAHSRRTAEIADWSLDDGANARQWGTGENLLQQWYVEPSNEGSYYLRNGHSNKLLTVGAAGAVIQSDPVRNRLSQQWEFVPANPDPTETVVGHYRFDQNGQDNAQSNDAELSGGPAYAAGVDGAALVLDGVNDYATLPAGVAASDDLTVAAWVRWDGGPAWQRVFDFGDDTTSNLFLTPASNAGTMRFAITNGGIDGEQVLETDSLPVGEWVHLAVTLGGNTGVLYVNGEPRTAGQILIDPSDFDPANNYIGRSQYPDPLFDGLIDDFRVYRHALDATQIAELISDGDLNGDGLVDAADYVVWRNHRGATGLAPYTPGDANGDGAVDAKDLAVWRRHYGRPSGPALSAPEPATLLLVLFGAAATHAAGRRVG